MARKLSRQDAGFTILEILVALALSSIVLFFVYEIFGGQHRLQVDEGQKLTLQQDGRAVLNLMARGMRIAGYAPTEPDATAALNGESVSAGLSSAAIDCLEYSSDLNENGRIDANEKITYRLNASDLTILERQVGSGSPETVLDHVAAFAVLYAWDKDGAGSKGYGDLEPEGNGISWCYDSNDDDELDLCFEPEETDRPDVLEGVALGTLKSASGIPMKRIRGARLWVLLESGREKLLDVPSNNRFVVPVHGPDSGLLDTSTLDSNRAYRLFTTTVKFRNMYF